MAEKAFGCFQEEMLWPQKHAYAIHSQQKLRRGGERRRNPNPRATGAGMQAVFLEKPSAGTGVFLPRGAGATNGNTHFNNRSSASSRPVLLPLRVVQTLNLNVHQLGQPHKRNMIGDNKMLKLDGINDSSPEIFLPKEWPY